MQLPADGQWTLLTICALSLPWSGVARFELELSCGGGGVEVSQTAIAHPMG